MSEFKVRKTTKNHLLPVERSKKKGAVQLDCQIITSPVYPDLQETACSLKRLIKSRRY